MNFKNILKIVLISSFSMILFFCLQIFMIPNNFSIIENDNRTIDLLFPVEIEDSQIIGVSKNNVSKLSRNFFITSKDTGIEDLTFSIFGLPIKTSSVSVLPNTKLVPIGDTIGVNIETKGILVLGTGYITTEEGENISPASDKIFSGDIILEANGEELFSKEDLNRIAKENKLVELLVKRDDDILNLKIETIIDSMDGQRKIGIWIRDSTQGIGTITYYNPVNKKFGALGHGVLDVDTEELMTIEKGRILDNKVISINRGEKGVPGELIGQIDNDNEMGEIKKNTEYGIFGVINDEYIKAIQHIPLEIATRNEIVTGPAKIISNINGDEIKEYDIYIEEINLNSKDSKSMIIDIVDTELLNKTNGIVQGMSGSPIIQNNKIIGAVTHVFIQKPTRGYGIFIENMLALDS